MSTKIKPCSLAPKHQWQWQKDVTLKTYPTPNHISFSRRGVFTCECGERKYGAARSGL